MVKLTRIYTKGGDKGQTSLGRAERRMTQLAVKQAINPEAIKYINRLSDHLFVLARRLNDGGAADVLWLPGGNR